MTKWSTGRCARNLNLIIQTNGISTIQANETHKLLRDFEIQTDLQISAIKPDLIIINKKRENLENCGLCCPVGPRVKLKECEKEDKYLDLAKESKKLWR